jgi:hypothetical protein
MVFSLPNWIKVHSKIFLFDSGFDSERALALKMVDFHGEVTFISVFDGIRDIYVCTN